VDGSLNRIEEIRSPAMEAGQKEATMNSNIYRFPVSGPSPETTGEGDSACDRELALALAKRDDAFRAIVRHGGWDPRGGREHEVAALARSAREKLWRGEDELAAPILAEMRAKRNATKWW